jgi:hypothetical protein
MAMARHHRENRNLRDAASAKSGEFHAKGFFIDMKKSHLHHR